MKVEMRHNGDTRTPRKYRRKRRRKSSRARLHVAVQEEARQEEIETSQRSKGSTKKTRIGRKGWNIVICMRIYRRSTDASIRSHDGRTTSPKMQDAREAKNAAATETQ